MSTLAEQIQAAVLVALTGATAAGTRVERERVDQVAEAECPAIALDEYAEEADPFGGDFELCRATLRLRIFTRGVAWMTDADSIRSAVHSALIANAPLAALVASVRALAPDGSAAPADGVAGETVCPYQFTYLRRKQTLAA